MPKAGSMLTFCSQPSGAHRVRAVQRSDSERYPLSHANSLTRWSPRTKRSASRSRRTAGAFERFRVTPSRWNWGMRCSSRRPFFSTGRPLRRGLSSNGKASRSRAAMRFIYRQSQVQRFPLAPDMAGRLFWKSLRLRCTRLATSSLRRTTVSGWCPTYRRSFCASNNARRS